MSVPGIGPIISSAMVAAIGAGEVFSKGRDFAAWLGLVPKQISTGDRTNWACRDEVHFDQAGKTVRRLAVAQLVVNASCYRAGDRTAKGSNNASQDILRAGQQVDRRTRKGDQQMANKSSPKPSVTHIFTAMTEHEDEGEGWQTRMTVTIWYEL